MAIADKDAHLELKKRARRRLVGATALALLAAIVLPMVMDEEPKTINPEIQLRIPAKDSPFDGRLPAEQATSARAESAAIQPAPPPEEGAPVKGAAPLPPSTPAEKAAPSVKAEAAQAKPDKPKPPKTPAPEARAPEKPASSNSGEDKLPPKKPAAKPVDKPVASKPVEKPAPKPAQKPAEKPAPKIPDSDAAKADAPAAEEGKSDEARAKAILDDKDQAAPPSAPPPTRYVLQLGAFADAEKARKVQARVKAEGYNAYTQSVNGSAGTKTRVRAGPFASREAADKARERLKQRGLDGIVAPTS